MAQQSMHSTDHFQLVISHCKEYGFVFGSSDIYDGLSAVYDYGPNGVLLKNALRNYWWKDMVQRHDNIVGLDAAIFMHPKTWKASGHVDAFNDPLIDNKDSKKRYRADVLVEEYIAKIEGKIQKDIDKARKRFGDDFDEVQFRETNSNTLRRSKEIEGVTQRLKEALEQEDLSHFTALINDLGIVCPISGSKNWTEVRRFNLMFHTQLGNISGEESKLYLRPETAQGIFVNFLNTLNSTRQKIPFGIAQTGKAFRNEIVARQFIFRMREFEQMEMQFFVPPGSGPEHYAFWKEERLKWHHRLGLGESNYRFHDHIKTAHYADAALDIEFKFPFGFKELEGIHSRTDFDLSQHEALSGKKLQVFDPKSNSHFTPNVIETSIGLDRLFLAVMCASLKEELLDNGQHRRVLSLPAPLAPNHLAILPLVKKDGLPELAKKIFHEAQLDIMCQYDDKDSIGKRYRRQDALGSPYCLTIDHDSLMDNQVTLRERDSMQQERMPIPEALNRVQKATSLRSLYQ